MNLEYTFYEPHQHARPRRPALLPPAFLRVDQLGRFHFNQAATERLDLLAPNARVRLGQHPQQPQQWLLQLVREGGCPLRGMDNGGTRGFRCQALAERLYRSLPYAPVNKSLGLAIDVFAVETSSGEAWPLDTAPYCCPPAPPAARAEKLTTAQVLSLPPGFRAQLARNRRK